jgi:glycosyltransferase involved in cell wall biosynthesis
MPKRILFLWTTYSGYMASCWKALANHGIQVKVICSPPQSGTSDPPFTSALLDGLDTIILDRQAKEFESIALREIDNFSPEFVAVAGWHSKAFRRVSRTVNHSGGNLILCMDNPFRGDFRQLLGRFYLASIIKQAKLVAVTGERCWQLARYLGADEEKIFKGVYGVDFANLSTAFELRSKASWPRQFVFTGRFEKRKGLDLLIDAFKIYQRCVTNPWRLSLIGNGPMSEELAPAEGIVNEGFISPERLPELLAKAGAFILPSREDAWPLSLVEAAAAGLPLIASSACGSYVELLRHGFNGFVAATGSVHSLAECMRQIHQKYDDLPLFGQRSLFLSEPWSAIEWAKRWSDLFNAVPGTNVP